MRAYVRACARAYVRACVRACAYAHKCVRYRMTDSCASAGGVNDVSADMYESFEKSTEPRTAGSDCSTSAGSGPLSEAVPA